MAGASNRGSRLYRGAIFIFLLGLPAPGIRGGLPAEAQILFWIRAGSLSPQELSPDPDLTPSLHGMMLEGVTVARLLPGDLPPATARDPAALARHLFDDATRARIQEKRGPIAVVGPEAPDSLRANSPSGNEAGNKSPGTLLIKRFGEPPPVGKDEEEAFRRIFEIFGKKPPPLRSSKNAERKPVLKTSPKREEGPDPTGLETCKQAFKVLEDGAPLVVALEPVRNPAGARGRDRVLRKVGEWTRREEKILILLMVHDPSPGQDGEPSRDEKKQLQSTLLVLGPGIRSGRIITGPRPLAGARDVALQILGLPPGPGNSREEFDVLEK